MTMPEAKAAFDKASDELSAASTSLHTACMAHATSQKTLETASKAYTEAKARVTATMQAIEEGVDKPDIPVVPAKV